MAEVRFDPGKGVEVGAVCPVPWFIHELEELDLTKVETAILILVQDNGQVTTRWDGGTTLEALGALETAKHQVIANLEEPEEEEDDEDSGD